MGFPCRLCHTVQAGAGPGCMVADWMPVHLNTNQYCFLCGTSSGHQPLPPSACTLVSDRLLCALTPSPFIQGWGHCGEMGLGGTELQPPPRPPTPDAGGWFLSSASTWIGTVTKGGLV